MKIDASYKQFNPDGNVMVADASEFRLKPGETPDLIRLTDGDNPQPFTLDLRKSTPERWVYRSDDSRQIILYSEKTHAKESSEHEPIR